MTPNLNTQARLKRAIRNNQKVYSAWESFRNFRWFTLAVVIILPIYPSFFLIGTGYEAKAGDYDETTIITAYEGDSGMEGSYINDSGLVSTDFDTVSEVIRAKSGSQIARAEPRKRNTIQLYKVVKGDTIEAIAKRYNISSNAIYWANDLSPEDILSVGQELRIPPVSGVVYKVVKGDTISAIASRYKVDPDDIVKVNELSNAASIRIGMELMIPGASVNTLKNTQTARATPEAKTLTPIPTEKPDTKPTIIDSATGLKSRYAVKYTGLSRGFVWGNCTWYVAQYKTVTWRGNANQWLKNAKAAGAKTGNTPIPGAIIQLSGRGYNPYYGHVGIVADVEDDHIIVKDMNYRKINEVTIRKIPKNDPAIDGYIYVD